MNAYPFCGCEIEHPSDLIDWDRVGDSLGSGDIVDAIEALARDLEAEERQRLQNAYARALRMKKEAQT